MRLFKGIIPRTNPKRNPWNQELEIWRLPRFEVAQSLDQLSWKLFWSLPIFFYFSEKMSFLGYKEVIEENDFVILHVNFSTLVPIRVTKMTTRKKRACNLLLKCFYLIFFGGTGENWFQCYIFRRRKIRTYWKKSNIFWYRIYLFLNMVFKVIDFKANHRTNRIKMPILFKTYFFQGYTFHI